jgi:hypothetical protein
MIIKIIESPKKTKRYRVYMDTEKHYDFGFKSGKTYLDGRTEIERRNYRNRHLANQTEKTLIENLVPSPSLFSYYLLWGDTRDLNKNANYLNRLWSKKHTKTI